MAAFKQFNSQDIIVSPLEVTKNFSFAGDSALSASNVGINRFLGNNVDYTSSLNIVTGKNNGDSQYLISGSSVYNSVKELYYSNYLTQSFGDNLQTGSVLLGANTASGVLLGSADSTGRYYNYLQTTLTQSRNFPTGSNAKVLVFSIPSKLYGDYIEPNSFILNLNDDSGAGGDWNTNAEVTDDGNGNLLSASINVGNIIYQHGIAILTQQDWNESLDLQNCYSGSSITCSFSSSFEIMETQYKCSWSEEEYNYSLNPTIISGSDDGSKLYDFATGSYFSPYITTVGMYNEQMDLLAVGKLAQPLPSSRTTDTTILVNIDR